MVPKKKFFLPKEYWIFAFFQFLFLHGVLNGVIFNVTRFECKIFDFFQEILQVP
jgi:hypothetical protein